MGACHGRGDEFLVYKPEMELSSTTYRKNVLDNKWMYKLKVEHDESKRYKARQVVKGCQEMKCVDYSELFFLWLWKWLPLEWC